MKARLRTFVAAAAVAAGLALTAGTTTATAAVASTADDVHAMDYWQYHDHYPTLDECHAAAQPWLFPTHPGGADYYECVPYADGWDLYLIFLT
ncbi:hypothetical protein ACTWP5_23565 [Streptomyces sp. 4N509B]|uniref:hypothetical protein n=1 Tax=Streptomyces sp. 4N509B TaxID=3457413 RepID=UPI003FD2A6FC